MVTFISRPFCNPRQVLLPGQTTVQYRVRSTIASEMTNVSYELDPNGSVVFAGNGHTMIATPRLATASGTPFSDRLSLAGHASPGTLVTIVVTIQAAGGPPQIQPAFVSIV